MPPVPPYLIAVSAFICERVLVEKDDVISAIRIVEIFYVPELPTNAPEDAVALIQAWCIVILKALPGHYEKHVIELKLLNALGALTSIGSEEADFSTRPELGSVPTGASLALQLNIGVKNYGNCSVCIYLDGEEIARAPFTIQKQQPSKDKA